MTIVRTTAWNRGLYGAVRGGKGAAAANMAMLWILNLSDRNHSVLDISARAGLPFAVIVRDRTVAQQHGLLRNAESKAPSHDPPRHNRPKMIGSLLRPEGIDVRATMVVGAFTSRKWASVDPCPQSVSRAVAN